MSVLAYSSVSRVVEHSALRWATWHSLTRLGLAPGLVVVVALVVVLPLLRGLYARRRPARRRGRR